MFTMWIWQCPVCTHEYRRMHVTIKYPCFVNRHTHTSIDCARHWKEQGAHIQQATNRCTQRDQ
jgi:hypothetical protein